MRQMVAMLVAINKCRCSAGRLGETLELVVDFGADRSQRKPSCQALAAQVAEREQCSAGRERARSGQCRKIGQHEMKAHSDLIRKIG